MTFSTETLSATLASLDSDKALRMIGLAGNCYELESLINGLARNFNVKVKPETLGIIRQASKRFSAVKRSRLINYRTS